MKHRTLQNRLGAFADGELRGIKRRRLEKHLAACPACRTELEVIRRLDAFARESAEAPVVPGYWESFPGRVAEGLRRRRREAGRPARNALFDDSFLVPESRLRTKAWALPLSIVSHAVVALLLIVLPLLQVKNLPRIEITSAFLAPPPPPPPPP
ncbi:MAG TPA: zf-HC2 domain-containing protein, partial [Candidatus Aminicenantes bacterium]|nr:zf-HC2 domain-containing protein [Candidatus Aminicenantes bacterium]HOS11211.1 zf-HC2 domain-containing protein [Candidatus Aminicenantes bacterium]HOU48584.1 zf-HC2 domain-containing protein [Candidatus Aminicenantes bacterium]HPL12573.1 zf-HC2 domain-containing protein [Candidatus Aminicenantes bacterium]HQF97469.1 zf-HC2 domain-containing protein [Candidatus Aminicenantes bacterium]